MQIEGTITSVFETWPVQLAVEAAGGRWHVSLSSDTTVTLRGQPAAASALRSGHRVRVTGSAAGPDALAADRIEVLA